MRSRECKFKDILLFFGTEKTRASNLLNSTEVGRKTVLWIGLKTTLNMNGTNQLKKLKSSLKKNSDALSILFSRINSLLSK